MALMMGSDALVDEVGALRARHGVLQQLKQPIDKLTRRQFFELQSCLPPSVVVDERSFFHGDFHHAYGHTADMLIYWTASGQGMTSRRDTQQTFHDLHDELFRGCYEYNAAYDLERLIAEGAPQ